MAIGDIEWIEGEPGCGLKEIQCDCVVADVPDPCCFMCEGAGVLHSLIAPDHVMTEIFQNIESQLPGRRH